MSSPEVQRRPAPPAVHRLPAPPAEQRAPASPAEQRAPASPEVVDVLLVEDDLADVLMVEEALQAWRIPTSLHVANDGVEATAFLRREGLYVHAPRPAFVLLDLNMPRKDGFEVLAEVKGDQDLSVIPIVVFSTSSAPEHVKRSYSAHANAYVVKPADFDNFAEVVREIETFYTQVVSQPPNGRPSS